MFQRVCDILTRRLIIRFQDVHLGVYNSEWSQYIIAFVVLPLMLVVSSFVANIIKKRNAEKEGKEFIPKAYPILGWLTVLWLFVVIAFNFWLWLD